MRKTKEKPKCEKLKFFLIFFSSLLCCLIKVEENNITITNSSSFDDNDSVDELESIFDFNIDDIIQQHSYIKARCLAKESQFEKEQNWPYNYKNKSSSEGGTVSPKANKNGGTLFVFPLSKLKCNRFNTIDSIPDHILSLLHKPMKLLTALGWKYIIIPHDTKDWETLSFPPNHLLYHCYAFNMVLQNEKNSNGEHIIIQGSVNLKPGYNVSSDFISKINRKPECGLHIQSFTGPVIIMRCSCSRGNEDLVKIIKNLNKNEYAWIPHTIDEYIDKNNNIRIKIKTGIGNITKLPFGTETFIHRNLSSLFKLYNFTTNEVIGKCLLSYYCSNFDEQGPTIEMFSIKRDYRGFGYGMYFYNEIEKYTISKWSCIGYTYNNKPHTRIMVTSQPGSEIEINCRLDGNKISITDRIFFSHYLGYDEHITATIHRDIPGQDQIKYYPITYKPKEKSILLPYFKKHYGKQTCFSCKILSTINIEFMRCSLCKVAFYCSKVKDCQLKDWPEHKLWCNKTRDEIDKMEITFIK